MPGCIWSRSPGAEMAATSGTTMGFPMKVTLSPARARSTLSARRITSIVRGRLPAGICKAAHPCTVRDSVAVFLALCWYFGSLSKSHGALRLCRCQPNTLPHRQIASCPSHQVSGGNVFAGICLSGLGAPRGGAGLAWREHRTRVIWFHAFRMGLHKSFGLMMWIGFARCGPMVLWICHYMPTAASR